MRDPYLFEDVEVLRNNLGIKNQEELDSFENLRTSAAIFKLSIDRPKITSLSEIFFIHKTLFEGVYDWAGKPRAINIYKSEVVLNGLSVSYTPHDYIVKEINDLDKDFKKEDWKSKSKKEACDAIVKYMSALWKIHPFREGNTRSVSALMNLFVQQIGLKLDGPFVAKNAKYFRNALVLNSIDEYSEPEHITSFMSDALVLKGVKAPDGKYQTIKGYELEKYKYNYHTYKE